MKTNIILASGAGRKYDMGRVVAIFKADGSETAGHYSVSEWRLAANTKGPGKHSHPEDDLFYVTEGIMSVYVQDKWIDAHQGSFILVPGGVEHDFENRTTSPAAVLNFSTDGQFEKAMPEIVEWYKYNPPQDAL